MTVGALRRQKVRTSLPRCLGHSRTCEEVTVSASSAELPLLSSKDPPRDPETEALMEALTDSAASAMSSSPYRRIRAAWGSGHA